MLRTKIRNKVIEVPQRYAYAFSFGFALRDQKEIDDVFAKSLLEKVVFENDSAAAAALEYLSMFNYSYYKAHKKEDCPFDPDYGNNNGRNRCINTVKVYTKKDGTIIYPSQIKEVQMFDHCSLGDSQLTINNEYNRIQKNRLTAKATY